MSDCATCAHPILDGQWRVSDWDGTRWTRRHLVCAEGVRQAIDQAIASQVASGGVDHTKEWWEDCPSA